MTAAALRLEAPADPVLAVAHRLCDFLQAGEVIDARLLRDLLASATGRSAADGGWSMRHAYDALELAQVLWLGSAGAGVDLSSPSVALDALIDLGRRLPTQTVRTEDQLVFQQFSTPAPIAWAMSVAAQLRSSDTVLEPSAGTGLLVWPAAKLGAALVLNEIDPGRRHCLQLAFPQARISDHDGELVDDLLPVDVQADILLINPPFARSFGRPVDRHAAARHLQASLRRLKSCGRAVAIMPTWFDRQMLGSEATIRLDAVLPRGLYVKHGTGIAVRLLVLDKLPAADEGPAELEMPDLPALLDAIQHLPARARPSDPMPPTPRTRLSLFRRQSQTPTPRPQPGAVEPDGEQPIEVVTLDDPAPEGEPAGIYMAWRPSRLALPGAAEHPTPLVESLAMGSIAAPKPAYQPLLPSGVVRQALLSAAQLETLVYAGGAFERDLPGHFVADEAGTDLTMAKDGIAYRQGFFLGDGTGAGKGRQIAGIIRDQWARGRKRHIWLSKNEALLEDARRDWSALGGMSLDVQPLSQWKLGAPITLDEGILFVTYPTLRSGREEVTRLQQILDWAGESFEGVIAFDEAHALANAAGGEGSRGRIKGSEQGLAGLRLQNRLPRARVLYVSATGASDVANLSYASRLGLWGPGTAFATREAFITGVRAGGIAAMELVARDLKALGLYTARALSFAGVEYDLLEHALTSEQVRVYDAYAEAWAIIHRNLGAALEVTRVVDSASGSTLNANAKSAALSRFESVKQRFFAQLLLSAKLPSLLPAIATDLEHGNAVVVQLVSTSEAMLDRRLADLDPAERETLEIDLSPREYVVDYLVRAFPTRQMRVFTDPDRNVRSEPMVDDQGHSVHCRAAIEARDSMVEQLCALPPVATALDAILERFGTDRVAEVTGRTRRLVLDRAGQQRLERRSPRSNLAEAQAFMDGSKKLLVFSDAGGTGRSYHACLKARNQARRIHYLLEPGWRADAAIQGLGRTHRSAQASAPLFRPVTTDVRGERRFISTIARRLDALGALTRGQRQTGGQNLFNPADNLESDYAKDALTNWYRLLFAGKLRSITCADFQERSGLALEAEGGGLRDDLPPIQRWLNRLLAFPIALQNAIFEEYLGLVEARVAAARDAGTLDLGVETLLVETLTVSDDRILRTDPSSGATSHLLTLDLERRPRPLRFEAALRLAERDGACLLVNDRSGRPAVRLHARNLLTEEGLPLRRYELVRPLRREHIGHGHFEETHWRPADSTAFAAAWNAEVEEATASTQSETMHLATGLLLPIWDALPDDHVQVLRVVDEKGRSLLGRPVPAAAVSELGRRFGLDLDHAVPFPAMVSGVLETGRSCEIPGTLSVQLKRSLVGGERRLELAGFDPARLGELKALGCFTEIIRYQTRLFVPVTRAAEIVERLSAGR
ncbi:strawberry notch-like NTP hydrolase domain-containing protein [Sphingomonas sp. BK345]|uniref:strawberry notch-like NTP hydrolase domain-containing protein n=1 Tax=Sphingomonas sp. BK345 TaxID=2586980 RepID=UPI00161D3E80|nr:strawberry notch family protein [Sphingomonas sp. BK345]MBB3473613.1 putative RNA methylase [Sphingomonas sp. BK345]